MNTNPGKCPNNGNDEAAQDLTFYIDPTNILTIKSPTNWADRD